MQGFVPSLSSYLCSKCSNLGSVSDTKTPCATSLFAKKGSNFEALLFQLLVSASIKRIIIGEFSWWTKVSPQFSLHLRLSHLVSVLILCHCRLHCFQTNMISDLYSCWGAWKQNGILSHEFTQIFVASLRMNSVMWPWQPEKPDQTHNRGCYLVVSSKYSDPFPSLFFHFRQSIKRQSQNSSSPF